MKVKIILTYLLFYGLIRLSVAQSSVSTSNVSDALKLRVEAILRMKSQIPAAAQFVFAPLQASTLSGFNELDVQVEVSGVKSEVIRFLISEQRHQVIEYAAYDVASAPKLLIGEGSNPGRGGTAQAPVHIVVFDDLECPFCAKFDNEIVPELLKHYGNSIRIVYRDFPLEGHPWARHAANDLNCLASVDPETYWRALDYLHRNSTIISHVQSPLMTIDNEIVRIAEQSHLKIDDVRRCLVGQDDRIVNESIVGGQRLAVESTPTLFINGLKIAGVPDLKDLSLMIDRIMAYEERHSPVKTDGTP